MGKAKNSIPERCDVPNKDRWNVDSIYLSLKDWEKEFQKIAGNPSIPRWPALHKHQGKLGDSAKVLKETLVAFSVLYQKLSKLFTYAHLKHDEDITHDGHKTAYGKAMSALHDFSQEGAWLEPEILAIDDKIMKNYLKSPLLSDYKFYIETCIRRKKHTLSTQEERLMAMASKAMEGTSLGFRAINDADFKFGVVKDKKGKEHELTHGSYGLFMRDQDRTLRQNAFIAHHGKYRDYQNTLCELLRGEISTHIFNAKARGYTSSLEATLHPKNIDTSVYHSLITAVNNNLKILHKYTALRSKKMKLPSLHLYDMSVPLVPQMDIKMAYKDAEEVIIESVAPLGSNYQNLLKKGLKDERWVDRFENKNKRSGAYSSGCYDSMPFILMNYKGLLRDVFTLAHEAGHSMHSLLTHTNQPFQYSNYPIFLAEVASTFNEDLLIRLLLERVKTKEERAYLINQKIDDIRGTLFRQTMFAEFELWLHETAEKDIPLTPHLLNKAYRELNQRYYGSHVVIDPEAELEWARIPHFYYNFYVYQYATGISAALALSHHVCGGGAKEREAYLSFLKAGCSRYPLDILKDAGVDMCSAKPVASAIATFGKLVDELDKLL